MPPAATAELIEGTFMLQATADGRIDADFELVFRRDEHGLGRWTFGWLHQDVSLPEVPWNRDDEDFNSVIQSMFEDFMCSLLDDHVSDLRIRGLEPARGFNDLPVGIDVSDEVRRIMEARR